MPLGDQLYVVPIKEDMRESEKLSLLSIQGIVNRGGAVLYLDFDDEISQQDSMLNFLRSRHDIAYEVVARDWIYDTFLSRTRGVVVYDEERRATINIATIYSGLYDYVVADTELADFLKKEYGLEKKIDLHESPWKDFLSDSEMYEFAFQELYPLCGKGMIAILQPEKPKMRDYLIATRTFTFYLPQGPFASSRDMSLMDRILEKTPVNIPLIGWFDTPTKAEENYAVQKASKYGKIVFGGEKMPNLSFLSSIEPRKPFKQTYSPSSPPPLQNKVYLTFAVPDGDNLDFIVDKMMELWKSQERGTIPLAWTINPLDRKSVV